MTEGVPFSELLEAVIDNRGKTCPTAERGIPLIATNCIRNEALYPTYEKARFVSSETYATWFRGHPRPGDILFVNKATPGRVCLVPDPVDFCIAQDMVAVRANNARIYPKYLFAALRSSGVQEQIAQMHVGTLIPHFKKGDFDKLLIPVPSRQEQEFIGDLYFALSAKIDLNRRMSETLEAMAKALFKSWFVDFDSVRAKAEGRSTGLPPDLDILFPDSFEESGSGEFPAGWKAKSLGDFVSLQRGTTYKSSLKDLPGPYLLGLGSIRPNGGFRGEKLSTYGGKSPEMLTLRPGDLYVSLKDVTQSGDLLGAVARVPSEIMLGRLTQDTVKLILMRGNWISIYLYLALLTPRYRSYCRSHATGTTNLGLSRDDFFRYPLLLASQPVNAAFNKLVEPMNARVDLLRAQTRTLQLLRDTLLPKLMSGELRVGHAERTVEKVA